jgi:hypothetical protein
MPWQRGGQRSAAAVRSPARGAAMVIVMVFITLSLLSLTYGFERTRQLFAFEEQAVRIAGSENGVEKALGIGIARLRSGVPDDNSYSCRLKLRNSGGGVARYDVIYTKVSSNHWTVEAYPGTSQLDDCPDVFAASCPVAP